MTLVFEIPVDFAEVAQCFPANLNDSLHIDRVDPALAWFEGNLGPVDPVVPFDGNR